jgi:putative transcriptional regulator
LTRSSKIAILAASSQEVSVMAIVSRFKVLLAEKEVREKRTISLRQVVRETGVPISTVQGLANNSLREFPGASLEALCDYLGCRLGDLLVIEEEQESAEKNGAPRLVLQPAFG